MCNFQITPTRQCKISPKKDLCHIHQKKSTLRNKDEELKDACLIITLNQKIDILSDLIKINKKEYDILYDQHIKNIDQHNVLLTFVEKINQQNTNAKNEIKNLNKTVLKKSDTQKQLQKSIDSMQKDYDNYQIIKQYEKEKSELITNGIDIYNHYDDEFHNKRYQRNQLAHAY